MKATRNLAKHGVPFEYATHVFLDPCRLERSDERHEYGEPRRIVVGVIQRRVFVVAYTMRGEIVRLISARKANEREQRLYYETLPA